MCGSVLDQVLRIDLRLIKHNKNGGVLDVVHTTIIEVHVSAVFGRRPAVLRRPPSVASNQHVRDEYGSELIIACVAV